MLGTSRAVRFAKLLSTIDNAHSGPDSVSTRYLIQRIQAGDLVAREELYARCVLPVLFLVRINLGSKLREKVDSWDIVQEALLRSLNDLATFDPQHSGAFHNYLAKKVEQVILDQVDYWKAAKRDPGREATVLDAASPHVERLLDTRQSRPPAERLILREDLRHLAEAMDELAVTSPTDWEMIVSLKLIGQSLREVAEHRNCTVDAVKMKQRRAMLKLASIFRRQEQTRQGKALHDEQP